MFGVIVFTPCYSCIIAKTPEDGFRKQRSIGDDASQGGHASRRRFSQKEGRDLWDLGRARASDSRFGPRRAVQHLAAQQPSAARSLEFRPMLTSGRFTVQLSVLLSTFVANPSVAAYCRALVAEPYCMPCTCRSGCSTALRAPHWRDRPLRSFHVSSRPVQTSRSA